MNDKKFFTIFLKFFISHVSNDIHQITVIDDKYIVKSTVYIRTIKLAQWLSHASVASCMKS